MHMAAAGTATRDYERFLAEESSNYDDSGFFSIQVLQKSFRSIIYTY
jgi:Ataxin-3